MDDFLTTDDAAKILKVTTRRVRAMIASGRLPAQTLGTGLRKVHLITRKDLDLLVNNRKPGRPKGKKNGN